MTALLVVLRVLLVTAAIAAYIALAVAVPPVHARPDPGPPARVNAPYDVWRVSGRVTGYVAEDDPRYPVPTRIDYR